MMAGIERADRWLQVALSVARNHREYADVLGKQAERKLFGSELVNVQRQFAELRVDTVGESKSSPPDPLSISSHREASHWQRGVNTDSSMTILQQVEGEWVTFWKNIW